MRDAVTEVGVFAVGNCQGNAVFLADLPKVLADKVGGGRDNDVTDAQNIHGVSLSLAYFTKRGERSAPLLISYN